MVRIKSHLQAKQVDDKVDLYDKDEESHIESKDIS